MARKPMVEHHEKLTDQYGHEWYVVGDDPDHTGLPFVRSDRPFYAICEEPFDDDFFDPQTLTSESGIRLTKKNDAAAPGS